MFAAHRLGIYSHVFGSVFALALGPVQFSARLRARNVAVHRWLGRLYLGVGVLVGGSAGLFMAIRAREVAAHRRWMVRNFALTFAAGTLRIYLPGSMAAGIPFEVAYPAIAWLCWVPNLVAAEVLTVRRTHDRPADAHGKACHR